MTMDKSPHCRIGFIDGLRGVAILSVVIFHYFGKFTGAKVTHPYGYILSDFPLVKYGFYGVQLFFAISGFVIFMTLERCSGFQEFSARRFGRLWPAMALCATFTFTISTLFSEYSIVKQNVINFLPSLTFVDPDIFNKIFQGRHFLWIDGAYWSLFVEIRFYFISAALWFLLPGKFTLSYTLFSILAVSLFSILTLIGAPYHADLLQRALAASYLPWFLIGISARLMQQRRLGAGLAGLATAWAELGLLTFVGSPKTDLLLAPLISAFMVLPFRWRQLAELLETPFLIRIGIASYSLYLLHGVAGLTLIGAIAAALGVSGPPALLIAFAVGLGMMILAFGVYHWWEEPLNRLIVRKYRTWFMARRAELTGAQ